MIRDLGESVGSTLFETVGRLFGRAQEQRPLPVDLYESDDAFLAVFDAPGAHPADIQVKYEGAAVVVRIDRFRDFYEGFEMQFPGRGLTLEGRVELPDDAVDADGATATLTDDGTLRVHVPRVQPAETGDGADHGSADRPDETGSDDPTTDGS